MMISQWALFFCHLPFIDHVWCDVNISSRYVISLGTWPLLRRLRRNRQSDWYAHIWRPLYLSVLVSFMPINGNLDVISIMALYGHTDISVISVSISPCPFYAQICSSVMSSVHIWSWLICFARLPWWHIFGRYLGIFGRSYVGNS